MPKYKTKAKAMSAAKKVGLRGVHKMADGTWMPGKTHSSYLKATKKKKY